MSAPATDEAAGRAGADHTTAQRLLALATGILLGAAGLVAGGVVAVVAVVLVTLTVGSAPMTVSLPLLLVASQVGIALVALLYLRWRPRFASLAERRLGIAPPSERIEIGAHWPSLRDVGAAVGGWIAAMVGLVAVGQIVNYVLQSVVEQEPGANPTAEAGFDQPELLLLLIPFMFLAVGPAEELLFRGVVQSRLRQVFGRWPAIVLASVVFAGLHYFVLTGGQPAANAVAVSALAVPAIAFGAAYEYTGNLVVPALIHAMYNSTLLLILYAGLQYSDEFEESASILAGLV